jgi:hypothetical protein
MRNVLETLLRYRLKLLARRGQGNRAVQAIEQLDTEMLFEHPDVPAHCLAADAQLAACLRHAQVPRGSLERNQAL